MVGFFSDTKTYWPSPGGGLGGGFGRRMARAPGFPSVKNLLPRSEEQPPSGRWPPPPRGRLVCLPSPGGGLGRGLLATPKPEIRSPVHSQPASRLLHPTSRISTNNPPPVASQPPPPRGRQEGVRSECSAVFGHRGPRPEVRRLWFSLRVYFAITQSVFSCSANIASPPLGEGWVGVLDAARPERQASRSWRTCSLRPRNNPPPAGGHLPKGEACLFYSSSPPLGEGSGGGCWRKEHLRTGSVIRGLLDT